MQRVWIPQYSRENCHECGKRRTLSEVITRNETVYCKDCWIKKLEEELEACRKRQGG